MLLVRVEAILKEDQRFQELQILVSKIQSFIMVNKSGVSRFEQDDKILIKELFAIKPEEIGTVVIQNNDQSEWIGRVIRELEEHKETLRTRKDEVAKLNDCV